MKLILTLISLCVSFILSAQKYSEVLPPESIRTVQLFNPQTNDQMPLIRLGSEYLILSFDDLNAGFQEYNYKIEHYNADWTPSGIFQSEFLDGYSSDYIRTYRNSFNTYQIYTHYQLQIPNRDTRLKVAGNYVIKVYTKDENNPVFTRRFAVYDERKVSLGVQTERAIGSKDLTQRVNVLVSSPQMNLTETPDGATLFIMKNNNWEDNLTIKKPQFTQNNQLTYRDQNNLFEGGSEYLWFDTKTLEVPALTTERVFRQDSLYHAVIRADFQKHNLSYFDDRDVNGAFYIRNARLMDQTMSSSEADYVWVHFALDEFNDAGGNKELYIVGSFNNWQIAPQYQLKKTDADMWEAAVLLKQGYYNYQYAVYDNSTQKISMSEINGSFWQTENLYQALFYYRPWGVRYDVLMGYGEANTRN
ncbi:type IX secretion system plug protein [Moheibacter sediminis]|uniref:Type 9 secretion system plug protein N-terminal domain-containing protein n=1 Tax=Moheibacter sediminis TaxID=1434700 RepID=A0A1W1ZRK8_9FLAO|nr:type IX secretion system plug protein domain-containing protein [Moheibacter sediminis]SMC50923.1 protein of unknown function [Moheibacter sediminis]